MNVEYTPEAREGLALLEADNPPLAAAVNRELDAFEADPSLTRWRARGYAGVAARTRGFVVRGPSDDVLVLWSELDDRVVIWTIGDQLLR